MAVAVAVAEQDSVDWADWVASVAGAEQEAAAPGMEVDSGIMGV